MTFLKLLFRWKWLTLVPSWHKKGTKLERLDWPDKQVYKEEDIKEVPSYCIRKLCI
jgi:hypothetical protein